MQMKRFFSFILTLVWMLSFIHAKETTIVIYSTNDIHGRINNFAKIAKFIKDERRKNPNILILGGGDLFTGNPIVDQYPQRGLPVIELMNEVGYDLAVLGNHEFDFGQTVLAKRIEEANFPFICANMQVNEHVAQMKQPHPYIYVEIEGIKIGILGLVECSRNHKGQWLPGTNQTQLEGITFTQPIETALEYKSLRKECDLFIGLFHTGYDTDKQIAHKMPELDVIIGGHSHTQIKSSKLENGVLITQAEDYLKWLGKTTLVLTDKKITSKKFELIRVEEHWEEDAKVKELIQKYHNEMPLEQVLAKANAQFDGKHPLGSLMTDAIIDIYQTDFAIQNSGGIRIGMIPKGDITLGDIYRLDPFGNSIIVYEMTLTQIRQLLKNAHHKGDLSVDLLPGGMKYTIYTQNGEATQIILTDMQGNPMDENKTYKIGMNSYIATSYLFDKQLPHQEMQIKATDALITYLKKQKKISPSIHARGIVKPE